MVVETGLSAPEAGSDSNGSRLRVSGRQKPVGQGRVLLSSTWHFPSISSVFLGSGGRMKIRPLLFQAARSSGIHPSGHHHSLLFSVAGTLAEPRLRRQDAARCHCRPGPLCTAGRCRRDPVIRPSGSASPRDTSIARVAAYGPRRIVGARYDRPEPGVSCSATVIGRPAPGQPATTPRICDHRSYQAQLLVATSLVYFIYDEMGCL